MYRLVLTLIIFFLVENSICQEIQIDTTKQNDKTTIVWRKGNVLKERKIFKKEKLIYHLKQRSDGTYEGKTFHENGQAYGRWFSKRSDHDLAKEFNDGLILIGDRIELNKNGDTLTYNLYPEELELRVFEEEGDLYPLKTVKFTYFDNGNIKTRTELARIKGVKFDPFELAPLGWQRIYHQNGKIDKEELYQIPKGKYQLILAQNTNHQKTFAALINEYAPSGQITRSIRIEKNMVYGKGFYENGNKHFIGETNLKNTTNYEEFENVIWFNEDGTRMK